MCALKLCCVIYSDIRNDFAIGSIAPFCETHLFEGPRQPSLKMHGVSVFASRHRRVMYETNFPNYYESSVENEVQNRRHAAIFERGAEQATSEAVRSLRVKQKCKYQKHTGAPKKWYAPRGLFSPYAVQNGNLNRN